MSRFNHLLPKSLEVNGIEYEIRSDYRDILEIMKAIQDPELTGEERAEIVLTIFYPALDEMPIQDYQEAVNKLFWFIRCGRPEKDDKKKPAKLVDWDKDFRYMAAPINKVVGAEIRSLEYMHWWTFKAAWDEIDPDCTWGQIIKIRSKKAKNKPLDKSETAWYRENRDLVDFAPNYTESELDFFAKWGGVGGGEPNEQI